MLDEILGLGGLKCPKCGSTNISRERAGIVIEGELGRCICNDCGHAWTCVTKAKGGCFITTAVCQSLNKGDDCYELQKFREFRDNWLKKQPDGYFLIREYYEIAPLILHKIMTTEEKPKDMFKYLWNNYLNKCLTLIESQSYSEAKDLYIKMVTELKKKYLPL